MFGLNEILTHSLAYAIGEDEGRAKARKEDNNPWYTGTPPKNKEGWCLIMVMVTDCDRTEFEEYEAVYWHGDYWDKRHKQPVVKWQPIDLHEKREGEE